MFAVSFEPCINSREASSRLLESPAFCKRLHAKPKRCVVPSHSTQACLASRFRRPRSPPGCRLYRSTRTPTPKYILQPGSARRTSFKCRAAGALVQDGWPLWAVLSACAAGGQVHLQNSLEAAHKAHVESKQKTVFLD